MLPRRPRTFGLLRVEIGEVRSLPKHEAAWRQFWALCLCRPRSRSWLAPALAAIYWSNITQSLGASPSIACWRDHSAGASRRRATPMPRGNRPSIAAFTSVGERKASEIVILTCRALHFSRVAISSTSAIEPVAISSSQRRPQAMDVTSAMRVSERIGRMSCPADTGAIISRRRLNAFFFQGI